MATPARSSPPALGNAVQAVRRFNRFYTRHIGVLQEHLLHSRFSLTEVRVLYELAHRSGITAIELRNELGLDRGYLSRMLQHFEKQGWITTKRSAADKRRILLSLTPKGQKAFAPLDLRSSAEVAAMLACLSGAEQNTLLGAMSAIESTLNRQTKTGEVPFAPRSSDTQAFTLRSHRPGDMGWVVQRHGELYWKEYNYDERFEALVAEIVVAFVQKLDPERERCWIAERDGERLGTIFLVRKSKTVAKLRLLLVEPSARGLGIGRRLVSECVDFARQAGYKRILLWTQSELHAARHLYQEAGFKRTAQKPHQSWGRNDLTAETWSLDLQKSFSPPGPPRTNRKR